MIAKGWAESFLSPFDTTFDTNVVPEQPRTKQDAKHSY